MEPTNNDSVVSFKDTLNLPHTDFPIRPQASKDDPALIVRWEQSQLYEKAMESNKGNEQYILHDGPPYANGHIHLGHAYNKILKDIVTKSRRMMGCHTPIKPGWDCHGLPIEHKVSGENPGASRAHLQQLCREYAQKWIDVQRTEFKRLGIIMDWQHPYITMDHGYEAATIRAFGEFVAQNCIERKNKTVPWCPSDQTVLASAEIEYKDRKDPSVYALFRLNTKTATALFPNVDGPIDLIVWTTTPWTLPLNRAVMLKPKTEYAVVEIEGNYYLLAQERAAAIAELKNVNKNVIASVNSEKLADALVHHPFIADLHVPIILDEEVGLSDGTAVVHCAPGCGPIDYEIGVKNDLEIYSPITTDGKYADGIEPKELKGMPVADGQIWVIKKLHELGRLFHKANITHSYPHCWRCHSPLIFRATPQWFFNLNKDNVKERSVQAINGIEFHPEQGKNFLKATVEHRWEWCLSRQRAWGTPIPALLCHDCDYAFTSQEFINKVADQVAKEGIEYWTRVPLEGVLPKELTCARCNTSNFYKETDILDVWFDSGISHYAVLLPEKQFPADLYLEGIDQHRGWFQSSLLTSMILEETPAMKGIMTHGFTVDGKGQKMSKSLGNVIAPQEIIDKLGTDGLRLWVASIGNDGDAVVSDRVLTTVAEVYRKIRNTCRGLLMNLYDYDHEKDKVAVEDLPAFDQAILRELFAFNEQLIRYYADYQPTRVFHELADYCSNDISSYYLDIAKDRLYCDQADGHARRSAQTTIYYILDTLVRLIAPVMSFTAELLADEYQGKERESIHLQHFAVLHEVGEFLHSQSARAMPIDFMPKTYVGHLPETIHALNSSMYIAEQEELWTLLREIRKALLKKLEELREKGIIHHSLEAKLRVYCAPELKQYGLLQKFQEFLRHKDESFESFLKEYMIVSQVEVVNSANDLEETIVEGVFASAYHADGHKCPRCWKWESNNNPNNLDNRCYQVIKLLRP
jgi:isoleucyl-tRNA synthetase